ncbi:MAG: Maf family protein [Oscillospiraceae bacterium]
MRLILASQSPRRCEILKNAGFSFEICPADIDETICENLSPSEFVLSLAKQKAQAVFEKLKDKNDVAVLGSDTIVVQNGDVLGKPKDEKDAFSMLSRLSGKKHEVYTGVSVVTKAGGQSFFDCTTVEFLPITAEQIKEYISTGEPMDKAGGYGIQGKGCVLIKGISGDFFSVMGLPISKTAMVLKSLGLESEQ